MTSKGSTKNLYENDYVEWLDVTLKQSSYLTMILEKDYKKARKSAIRKSRLSPETFPANCPYTLEQILDPDWLP